MPDRPSQPSSRPGAPAKTAVGRHNPERLAKALRDNLLKRKSQALARTKSDEPPRPGKDGSTK